MKKAKIKTQAKLDLMDTIKVLYAIFWETLILGNFIFLFLAAILPTIGLIAYLSDWKNHSIWEILFFMIFSIAGGAIAWISRDSMPMFFDSLKIKINELKNYQKEVIEGVVSQKNTWKVEGDYPLQYYSLLVRGVEYEVSECRYTRVSKGDKVIIEVMPESKLILGIKKVK